jgi:prepilin-type N-terminal cleavage/methylation domain-containing protein
MEGKKMIQNKKKQGFSLVELAIGLAVITVLILAVSISSGVRDNARVQSAANSVQTLRSAAENYLVTGKLNYSGLTVDALKTAKLLPDNFVPAKTNPWGGDFNITPNGSNNTRFDITLSALNKIDAEKLTFYFNNSASSLIFDESKNIWVATF